LLPIILFRLSEIVFGGIDASFPSRERTQVHLCNPKEEFIRNEEGPKGKENVHLPAVSKAKCCLSPDKESSLNVTSVSAQAIVMVFTWNSLIMKLSGKRVAIDSRWSP
jgi:hypothetical protein